MIACCGLDCSECGGFLATQADDDIKRAEVFIPGKTVLVREGKMVIMAANKPRAFEASRRLKIVSGMIRS